MKRDNNSIILWVVLAAAVLVGVYLFKDKLGICWSGNCKADVVQESMVVEAVEPMQSVDSEAPAVQSEEMAADQEIK